MRQSTQYGRIGPFGRTALTVTSQAIFNHIHDGTNGAPAGRTLRIAQRSATSWVGAMGNTTGGQGIPVAQLANVGRTASDPAFNPSTSVNVFRWAMDLDTSVSLGWARRLEIDAPLSGFGNRNIATGDREVYWWGDLNASTGDLRGTAMVTQGFISFVPTPASLALIGAGGMLACRRRRN
ncbi:MAG TPA: hypothetical protein VD997_10940 [Phycisphaerales bacterium]|nr:hypothetical protein [Phycisphaerales bacterium]